MSFIRAGQGRRSDLRAVPGYEQEHRRIASQWIGVGTFACARCDAPVAVGESPVRPADTVRCPYCAHEAPARDFLTLGAPTRPARVQLRLRLR